MSLVTIKKRSDFLTIRNQGVHAVAKGIVLQARIQATQDPSFPIQPRIGLVVSKKIGNAVTRNRIRRRLRALCAHLMPRYANPGYDYVLIARAGTLNRPFHDLEKDLKFTLHSTATYAALS